MKNKEPRKLTIGIGETGLPSLSGGPESEPTTTRHTETIMVSQLAATSQRALLTIVKGIDAGRVVPLGRSELTIGRAADCSLPLSDRGVSHKHARISRVDPDITLTGAELPFVLEDLGSKNGTFLDGKPLTEAKRIRPGDTFQIGPDVILRLVLMTDAEELAARQLFTSSMYDALTATFNRRYLVKRLKSELAYAARHKAPLSLCMFNYDKFKLVNDTHGQAAGDIVLKALTKVVMGELRTEDVLARVDNAEFAVLLRGIDEKGAFACAERIRVAIANRALPVDPPMSLTVSLGVATNTESETAGERLLELAGARLLAAKSNGRNQIGGPDAVAPSSSR